MKKTLFILLIFLMAGMKDIWSQGPKDMPEKIREIRKNRLLEELRLKDPQKTSFIQLYDDYLNRRRELNRAKREIFRRLALMTELGSDVPEEKVKSAILEFEKNEQQIRATQDKMMKDIQTLMTPVQIARFVVFEEQFEHRMREIMFRFRDKKERHGRGFGPPAWPLDDGSEKEE